MALEAIGTSLEPFHLMARPARTWPVKRGQPRAHNSRLRKQSAHSGYHRSAVYLAHKRIQRATRAAHRLGNPPKPTILSLVQALLTIGTDLVEFMVSQWAKENGLSRRQVQRWEKHLAGRGCLGRFYRKGGSGCGNQLWLNRTALAGYAAELYRDATTSGGVAKRIERAERYQPLGHENSEADPSASHQVTSNQPASSAGTLAKAGIRPLNAGEIDQAAGQNSEQMSQQVGASGGTNQQPSESATSPLNPSKKIKIMHPAKPVRFAKTQDTPQLDPKYARIVRLEPPNCEQLLSYNRRVQNSPFPGKRLTGSLGLIRLWAWHRGMNFAISTLYARIAARLTAQTATASRRDAFFAAVRWRMRHDFEPLPVTHADIARWLAQAEEWYAQEAERCRQSEAEAMFVVPRPSKPASDRQPSQGELWPEKTRVNADWLERLQRMAARQAELAGITLKNHHT